MEKNPRLIWLTTGGAVFLALAGLLVLFGFLYRFDNKYTAGPPYGREGLFSFKEEDLSKPLFLIDGWEFYPGELLGPGETSTDRLQLFVGQYSTFSQFTKDGSPFGAGTYRLTLTLDGSPQIMTLELPEIFTDYTLWADGQKIAARGSGTFVTFLMDRTVVLTLQTENHTHYYSGLTYPPILGTPDIINRLTSIRTLFYCVLVIVPLTLALFSLTLWAVKSRDILFWHFGLLCLCFSVPSLHPFIWKLGLSGRFWYALEDTAWFLVLAQTVAVASVGAGIYDSLWFRHIARPLTLGLSVLCFIYVYALIPGCPGSVFLYGHVVEGWRIICWIYLAGCASWSLSKKSPKSRYTLAACCCMGASLCTNLLDNNRFEPVYTGWQLEYSGFFLVLVFGGLMIQHNLSLIRRSDQLRLTKLQYKFARESAAQLRQSIDQVRALKHEIIHHVDTMKTFCESGDYERLQNYFEEIHQKKEALPPLYYCDNYLVNTILSSRLAPASRNGIQVSCRAALPSELNLPDTELCILFSNLLDNAVEACEALQGDFKCYIKLDLHLENQLFSIVCENSAKQCLEASDLPPSTKQKPEEHGFGLRMIRQIVEQYEGAMEINWNAGVFTVKILFYIPPEI